jgi:hypothetical protein
MDLVDSTQAFSLLAALGVTETGRRFFISAILPGGLGALFLQTIDVVGAVQPAVTRLKPAKAPMLGQQAYGLARAQKGIRRLAAREPRLDLVDVLNGRSCGSQFVPTSVGAGGLGKKQKAPPASVRRKGALYDTRRSQAIPTTRHHAIHVTYSKLPNTQTPSKRVNLKKTANRV